jgi:hypothetical protein
MLGRFQHYESETPFTTSASTSASGVKAGEWEYCLMRETEKSSIVAWCPLKGLMPASGVKAGKWEYCLAQETEIGSWIEGGVGIVL